MECATAPALTKFCFVIENIPWEISRRKGHIMHQRTLGWTRTANFSLRMRCCRCLSARFLCWIAIRIRPLEPCVSLWWRSRCERATLFELPWKTFEQDLHRKTTMTAQCGARTKNWASAFTKVANANPMEPPHGTKRVTEAFHTWNWRNLTNTI